MGEYATYNGESIKIGTCESMYYLRSDQRHLIRDYDFASCLSSIRFRFPFPDEDNIEPGHFEDYDRGVKIPGWELPDDFAEHYSVQFTSTAGYNLCIPCPESPGTTRGFTTEVNGLRVNRNGFNGGPVVLQQKHCNGLLVTVVSCKACGAAWRLETLEQAEPVAVAFRSEADRLGRDGELANGKQHQAFLHTMADRILEGYTT